MLDGEVDDDIPGDRLDLSFHITSPALYGYGFEWSSWSTLENQNEVMPPSHFLSSPTLSVVLLLRRRAFGV